MTTYEIVFYEKSDGTEPVKDFIMNLLPKMQAKTIRILDILRSLDLIYACHIQKC